MADTYILSGPGVLAHVIKVLRTNALDSKTKVTISNHVTKSDAQRGLQWKWMTEIAKQGIGGAHEDTAQGVHLVCKWRFAIPILCRDDDFFRVLYTEYMAKWGHDPERVRWFVDHNVSTEGMTVPQMAEYLTALQQFYISHGAQLTQPPDRRLLSYEDINYGNG